MKTIPRFDDYRGPQWETVNLFDSSCPTTFKVLPVAVSPNTGDAFNSLARAVLTISWMDAEIVIPQGFLFSSGIEQPFNRREKLLPDFLLMPVDAAELDEPTVLQAVAKEV